MLGPNSCNDTQPILKRNIYLNSFVTWTRESAGFLKYYLLITINNRLYFSTEFLIYYFANIFSGSIVNHTGDIPHSCSLSTLSILQKENIFDWYWTEERAKRLDLSYMSLYLLWFFCLTTYSFNKEKKKTKKRRHGSLLLKQKIPNPKFLVIVTCSLNYGAKYAFELHPEQYASSEDIF